MDSHTLSGWPACFSAPSLPTQVVASNQSLGLHTICDCLSNNQPSSHHKLKHFSEQLVATFNSYHYTVHPVPILKSLIFSGQLLTLCKYETDTIVPVECTKWMASTWNCTLDHRCVPLIWASRLTMASMSSLQSFFGEFFTSCCHLPPYPLPLPLSPLPL